MLERMAESIGEMTLDISSGWNFPDRVACAIDATSPVCVTDEFE